MRVGSTSTVSPYRRVAVCSGLEGIGGDALPGGSYLDMQAALGVSKHLGGRAATDELLRLCHADRAREVLDVGCGIGVGPVHVARTFRCRVTGVDLSRRMIGWARERSRQARVDDLVGLCAADVTSLPFPDDRFDVVICESVLDFVADKEAAVRECVRVTRPGGWVGLNEALWLRDPPPEAVQQVERALGPSVPTEVEWRSLWAGSGLVDRVVRIRRVEMVQEMLCRFSWIGWPWVVRAVGRAVRLCLTDGGARRSLKQQLRFPWGELRIIGYGLMAGRKPEVPSR